MVDGDLTYYLESVSDLHQNTHRWHLHTRINRFNGLVAVHHNNTHLGSDIYYIMGGSIPQTDNRDHHLSDLWASIDHGKSWILIVDRLP